MSVFHHGNLNENSFTTMANRQRSRYFLFQKTTQKLKRQAATNKSKCVFDDEAIKYQSEHRFARAQHHQVMNATLIKVNESNRK